ncbi:hypothetical protein Q3G72_003520 [Acer saccharum]|nr:hypothetical protein Q3G72_003520 [Acer saccharum]
MGSSSSQFGGCGHTCANSGNGYKGEIERKLYPTRDGRKLAALLFPTSPFLFLFGRRALRSVRKAWFSVCLQIGPPLVRLASERGSFGREAGRALPYGRASPATQAALFATTRKAKDSRVQA